MGHKRYWTAVTAAGMIGAMALGSAFTSYAAGPEEIPHFGIIR